MQFVLLSGGSGKRLWPLSNDVRSKQFIKIFDKADGTGRESMIQRIYDGLRNACGNGAGITISTRERAGFRDHVIGMCATKISAGVSTGIGSHVEGDEGEGDSQFEISDGRSLSEVIDAIRAQGLQPVLNDYVFI